MQERSSLGTLKDHHSHQILRKFWAPCLRYLYRFLLWFSAGWFPLKPIEEKGVSSSWREAARAMLGNMTSLFSLRWAKSIQQTKASKTQGLPVISRVLAQTSTCFVAMFGHRAISCRLPGRADRLSVLKRSTPSKGGAAVLLSAAWRTASGRAPVESRLWWELLSDRARLPQRQPAAPAPRTVRFWAVGRQASCLSLRLPKAAAPCVDPSAQGRDALLSLWSH